MTQHPEYKCCYTILVLAPMHILYPLHMNRKSAHIHIFVHSYREKRMLQHPKYKYCNTVLVLAPMSVLYRDSTAITSRESKSGSHTHLCSRTFTDTALLFRTHPVCVKQTNAHFLCVSSAPREFIIIISETIPQTLAHIVFKRRISTND